MTSSALNVVSSWFFTNGNPITKILHTPLLWYECMYDYVCVYACVHVCVCMCVYMCVCMIMYVCVCVCIHVYVSVCNYVRMYIRMYVRMCVRACMHVCSMYILLHLIIHCVCLSTVELINVNDIFLPHMIFIVSLTVMK